MIDCIIVGGGIVCTSMAYELIHYQFNVTLFVKEAKLSFGILKSNSCTIHTEFQDEINSIKGKLAVRVNQLYKNISRLLNFPLISTGDLVVVFPGERKIIEKIKERRKV